MVLCEKRRKKKAAGTAPPNVADAHKFQWHFSCISSMFSRQISVVVYYDANCWDQSHFTDIPLACVYLYDKIKRTCLFYLGLAKWKKSEKKNIPAWKWENDLKPQQTLSFVRRFEILKSFLGGASQYSKRYVSIGGFIHDISSVNLLLACVICHRHASSHFPRDALQSLPFSPPPTNQTTGTGTAASTCFVWSIFPHFLSFGLQRCWDSAGLRQNSSSSVVRWRLRGEMGL